MSGEIDLNALRGGKVEQTQQKVKEYGPEKETKLYEETSIFSDGTTETTTSAVNNPDKIDKREFSFPGGKDVSGVDFGEKKTGDMWVTTEGKPIDIYTNKKDGTLTQVVRNSDGTASEVNINYTLPKEE